MFSPTRLTFHLVMFVTAGRGAHWVDFERVALREGDILHVSPEQVHAFDQSADHEAWLLFFAPDTLTQAHITLTARWQPSGVLRPPSSDFWFLIEALKLQRVLDTDAEELRAETIGPHLLGTVLAGLGDLVVARRGVADPTVQRYEALVLAFEALVDGHLTAHRSPSWYAEALLTTPRTLARACRRVRDTSPKRLVDLRVALEAKRWLATTAETVEAVGYTLGFSEPTNFVKYFKRVVGTTPESFRRTHMGAV